MPVSGLRAAGMVDEGASLTLLIHLPPIQLLHSLPNSACNEQRRRIPAVCRACAPERTNVLCPRIGILLPTPQSGYLPLRPNRPFGEPPSALHPPDSVRGRTVSPTNPALYARHRAARLPGHRHIPKGYGKE